MPTAFTSAFDLLDNKGVGKVSLDAVQVFAANLDTPPNTDKVRVLFKQEDETKSGEIDSEGFLGLCSSLEKLIKGTSAEQLCTQFKTRIVRKLYVLCSSDGSGADGIKKEEFAQFYDAMFDSLKSNLTVTLFNRMLGEWSGETLNFDQFAKVIIKVISGMNIVTCLATFEKATSDYRRNGRTKGAGSPGAGGAGEKNTKPLEKTKSSKSLERFKGAAIEVKELNQSYKKLEALKEGQKHHVDLDAMPEDIFKDAFTLLDSRNSGVISLDSVYEFCDSLPVPPPNNAVKKIYNQFDEDGSGDIDSEEFTGFCTALEQLTSMSAKEMVGCYTKAQYTRLFELVDDGGDTNGLVSKDELKILLESISPILSTKYSAADIHNLVRGYNGELDFNDFCEVVKKLTTGKSISQVVSAFEEAKRRRKAAKHNAFAKFEHGKASKNPAAAAIGAVMEERERICFSCLEKDDKIKDQQNQIDSMQAELAMLRSNANATGSELEAARTAMQFAGKAGGGDEPTGNPFAKIRSMSLLHSASSFRRYPELIKPALLEHSTNRVLDHARFFCAQMINGRVEADGVCRSAVDLIPSAHDAVTQLHAVIDDIRPNVDTIHVYLKQMLQTLSQEGGKLEGSGKEGVVDQMELVQAMRDKLKTFRDDVNWSLEQVVSSRTKISDAASTVAPGSTRAKEIMDSLIEFEIATQDIVDRVTVLLMYGSDHISDVEFYIRKILSMQKESLSGPELHDLLVVLEQTEEQLKGATWDISFSKLGKTTELMGRHMTLSQTQSRNKAIQTLPQVDMRPLTALKKKHGEERPTDWDEANGRHAFSTPRSAAPRSRALKLDPKNMAKHVDSVLDRYTNQEGVSVPENFKRIEGKGDSHTYQFGSKKIELMPVDRFVAVKVGGGYLLFDEFCERYCAQENRKFTLEVNATPRPTSVRRSATPSYGRATPRTVSPGPSTPRVLIRHGGGLKLSDGSPGGFGANLPH